MNLKNPFHIAGLMALMVLALFLLDQLGLQRTTINFLFLGVPILGYATVGLICRTTNADQYYMAGRSIPAGFNGLATAADWLSAASVIGLSGLLLTEGYVGDEQRAGGLVYLMGWTAGFCLLAFLFAAAIRRSEAITIPEFLAKHYDSRPIRWISGLGAIGCSLVYLIAQIYGIGLVASMLSGLTFELGVLLALGGVLLCSFLGGMRAVTWTQVVQSLVIVVAMLGLAMAVSWKTTGHFIYPLSADASINNLQQLTLRQQKLDDELGTRSFMMQRVEKLRSQLEQPEQAYQQERESTAIRLEFLRAINAPLRDIHRLQKSPYLRANGYEEVVRAWRQELLQLERQLAQPTAFTSYEPRERHNPLNSVGLFLCLALGTVSLPHLLIRSGTAVNPREARRSMIWTLVVVVLVYSCASSLAVMIKDLVLSDLVGRSFSDLPLWVDQLRSSANEMLKMTDWNHDGWIQLGDVRLINDHLILATPEILNISPIFTGLIAAGALAAALSTADGLLLTISNTLVHDFYFQSTHREVSPLRRVMVSKLTLMTVALLVAWITTNRPVDILFWVACAFSLAASTFFPVLFLSIHWKGMTKAGALSAMVVGMSTAVIYIAINQPSISEWFGFDAELTRIAGLEPVAAGVLGIPLGFLVGIVVSLIRRGHDRPKPARTGL